MRLTSLRGRLTSALLVIIKCLAVYAVLAVGYHFLLEPVAKSAPTASRAVAETFQQLQQPAPGAVPAPVPAEVLSPAPVRHVRPAPPLPAPDAARAFAAVPPKKSEGRTEGNSEARPVTRQVVRTSERRERRSREAAFNPFNIFRPWF